MMGPAGGEVEGLQKAFAEQNTDMHTLFKDFA